MAIYDTMQYIKPNVSTTCIGQAASMGALLLAAGEAGKRYALPNSRVMIHQPLGGYQGQATDIDIHAREILTLRSRLNEVLAKHTGQSLETIARDTERDNFKSASRRRPTVWSIRSWSVVRMSRSRPADRPSRGQGGLVPAGSGGTGVPSALCYFESNPRSAGGVTG